MRYFAWDNKFYTTYEEIKKIKDEKMGLNSPLETKRLFYNDISNYVFSIFADVIKRGQPALENFDNDYLDGIIYLIGLLFEAVENTTDYYDLEKGYVEGTAVFKSYQSYYSIEYSEYCGGEIRFNYRSLKEVSPKEEKIVRYY